MGSLNLTGDDEVTDGLNAEDRRRRELINGGRAVPDLAEAFEEVEGVDALLVGEINNAIEAVVLDELERGIHLVRSEPEPVVIDG